MHRSRTQCAAEWLLVGSSVKLPRSSDSDRGGPERITRTAKRRVPHTLDLHTCLAERPAKGKENDRGKGGVDGHGQWQGQVHCFFLPFPDRFFLPRNHCPHWHFVHWGCSVLTFLLREKEEAFVCDVKSLLNSRQIIMFRQFSMISYHELHVQYLLRTYVLYFL